MMRDSQYGYEFDAIGNRIASTNGVAATSYAANALNQYTNVVNGGTFDPVHDDDGNCTQLREWALTWDGENRLIRADNGTDVVEYAYDYMSRRVVRSGGGVSNRFDYDGWALIRERTLIGAGATTNRYYYGPDLSGTLQGAGTVGGLWLRTGEGRPLFYTYDGNGNVSEIIDDTGAVRGHYAYDPFGRVAAMTGDLAAINPIRFSTKRQDELTALLYYGYRDLDTVWGRWLSRDPIGERGGANLASFAYNDSLNSWDILGLSSTRCCDGQPYDPKKYCCIDNTLYPVWNPSQQSRWNPFSHRFPLIGWATGPIGDMGRGLGSMVRGNFGQAAGQIGGGVSSLARNTVGDVAQFARGMTQGKAQGFSVVARDYRKTGNRGKRNEGVAKNVLIPNYWPYTGANTGVEQESLEDIESDLVCFEGRLKLLPGRGHTVTEWGSRNHDWNLLISA